MDPATWEEALRYFEDKGDFETMKTLLGAKPPMSSLSAIQQYAASQRAQAQGADLNTPEKLKGMLESRFRGKLPSEVMHCHKVNDTTVAVFVIANGKASLVEDGLDLFPSDTLMTQLRMIGSQ